MLICIIKALLVDQNFKCNIKDLNMKVRVANCYNFQKYKMNDSKIPEALLNDRGKLIELINRLL